MTSLSTMLPYAEFLGNENVEAAIQTLIRELKSAQSSLTGARPAMAELKESYHDYLDRVATVKGKAALYPYVGSGLGNGPLVQLCDGSVKWDMINGIGVHMMGHSDPTMVETAVRAALGDTVMQGNLQFNADSIEFAELLVKEASRTSKIAHCFLTNSGAMSNESALKVCFQKRDAQAPRVLVFKDCFMGRSTTMCQIGDSAGGRQGVPLSTLVDYIPFYDPDRPELSMHAAKAALEEVIHRYPGQHACFAMELVQGEGGFRTAPREFFEPLCRLCRENGIAIWFDEVQTFGRNEAMFYFEQMGLGEWADVVTIGKMSQICACLYTEAYNPKPGLLSGTFIGSTVGLNVGLKTLETLRDGGYYGADGRNAQLQTAFREHAKALIEKHPQWFPHVPHPDGCGNCDAMGMYGGVGGMMRLTPFGGDKARIMRALMEMFDLGVIAFLCGHGPYHIRFLAPVGVLKPEHFGEIFSIMETAFGEVAGDDSGD